MFQGVHFRSAFSWGEMVDAIGLDARYVAQTYNRFKVILDRGKGALAWDVNGMEYVDCVGGISVMNVGHGHPRILKVISEQAAKLIQCSNWFYNEHQSGLAELLATVALPGVDTSYLCNSGTEANEGAIKLARKFTRKTGIIAMETCFHGRTMGSLALTWKEKYKKPFEPLMPGAKHVKFNDACAAKDAIDENTATIIVEPIQAEGGIIIPDDNYLAELREICDARHILLIFDEVQTGLGRTGRMFACEHWEVVPDILTMAKSLAGGLPIGAMMAKGKVMGAFAVDEHGTTFGGGPLVCAAAIENIKILLDEKLPQRAAEMGEYFMKRLVEVKSAKVKEVRGKGLLIGVEMNEKARPYCERMIRLGVLSSCPSDYVIRFVPPLVITREEIDRVVEAFGKAIA